MKEKLIKLYGQDLSKWKPWVWPDNWGWLRVVIPYQKTFYNATLNHDILYTQGWEIQDKNSADNLFLKLALSSSKNKCEEYFALLYFEIIVSYGCLFFNWKWKCERT